MDEMEVENNGSKKATSTHIRLQTKSMKQVCDKRCALKRIFKKVPKNVKFLPMRIRLIHKVKTNMNLSPY
jgi:hypothetical protein